MRLRRRLLAALALLALAEGCRHVEPRPLSPERTAAELERRSLDDAGLRDFLTQCLGQPPERWPLERWRLPELTWAALYFQPDLRVARASAEVASVHVGAAGQRPNPTLSVAPQRVANAPSAVSPWLAAVQIAWPIETAGKRAHRRAAAEARASAAELAVRTAAWRVRADVYDAVVGLSAAEARRATLDRGRVTQERLLALLEKRRAAGAIAETIVAPQRLALAQERAAFAAAERQCLETRARLAAALGMPRDALDAVEIEFPLDTVPPELEALGSAGARRAALLGRSDVLAMLAEYAAAESDLRLELAKQVPDLQLGPTYEFDQGDDKWGFALSLEIPLMNRNGAAIDEALARCSEVAARFEARQAQVIAEVDAASAALRGARMEQENARSLLVEARERWALAETALEQGAIDRVGVLDAELEAEHAAGLLVDAEERLHQALARLEQAVEPARAFIEATPTGRSAPQ
jgi:outer membrane protein TolC